MAWQNALNLRAHLWAARDFNRRFAVIRRMDKGAADYPDGREPRWDVPGVFPFPTGPGFLLTALNTGVNQHWEWLGQVTPTYLMTHPAIVRGLAELAAERGPPPFKLKGITTVAEMVDRDLRNLVLRHHGTEIHDAYSCGEAGVMAIQCPDNRHYHVQSEAMVLEILDENDRPCRVGAIGRVVVTPLYNYATPLFRYEVGDYAEAGAPCACGRSLPVIKRIMGRRRNLFTLPDGSRIWPTFNVKKLGQIVSIRRHKFVQTARDAVDVFLVTDHPISPEEEDTLITIVASVLPMPFKITIRRVDEIPQPESGKYEEYVSLVD